MEALAAAARQPLALLSLEGNALTWKAGKAVSRLVEASTATLETLKLGDNALEDTGCAAVATAAAGAARLATLDLRGNGVSGLGMMSVRELLRVSLSLRTLVLPKNMIDDAGCGTLAQGLAQASSLTALNLRFNSIGDAGVEALSQVLPRSNLLSLDVGGNRITAEGAAALAVAAATPEGSLKKLNLRSNQIGGRGTAAFGKVLAMEGCPLQELFLGFNGAGEDAVVAVMDALLGNSTLRKLDVQGVPLSTAGEEHLATLLRTNTTLTQIVAELDSRPHAGRAAAVALLANTSLRDLALGGAINVDEKRAAQDGTAVGPLVCLMLQGNQLLTQVTATAPLPPPGADGGGVAQGFLSERTALAGGLAAAWEEKYQAAAAELAFQHKTLHNLMNSWVDAGGGGGADDPPALPRPPHEGNTKLPMVSPCPSPLLDPLQPNCSAFTTVTEDGADGEAAPFVPAGVVAEAPEAEADEELPPPPPTTQSAASYATDAAVSIPPTVAASSVGRAARAPLPAAAATAAVVTTTACDLSETSVVAHSVTLARTEEPVSRPDASEVATLPAEGEAESEMQEGVPAEVLGEDTPSPAGGATRSPLGTPLTLLARQARDKHHAQPPREAATLQAPPVGASAVQVSTTALKAVGEKTAALRQLIATSLQREREPAAPVTPTAGALPHQFSHLRAALAVSPHTRMSTPDRSTAVSAESTSPADRYRRDVLNALAVRRAGRDLAREKAKQLASPRLSPPPEAASPRAPAVESAPMRQVAYAHSQVRSRTPPEAYTPPSRPAVVKQTPPPAALPAPAVESPHAAQATHVWKVVAAVRGQVETLEETLNPQLADMADIIEALQLQNETLRKRQAATDKKLDAVMEVMEQSLDLEAGEALRDQSALALETAEEAKRLAGGVHAQSASALDSALEERITAVELAVAEVADSVGPALAQQEAVLEALKEDVTAARDEQEVIGVATEKALRFVQEQTDTLQEQTDTLQARVDGTEAVAKEVADVKEAIDLMSSGQDRLAEELEVTAASMGEKLDAVRRRVETLEADGAEMLQNTTAVRGHVDALRGRVDVLGGELSGVASQSEACAEEVRTAAKLARALEPEMAALASEVQLAAKGAKGCETALSNTTGKLNKLLAEQKDFASRLLSVEIGIDKQSSTVKALQQPNAEAQSQAAQAAKDSRKALQTTEKLTQSVNTITAEWCEGLSALKPKIADLRAAADGYQDTQGRVAKLERRMEQQPGASSSAAQEELRQSARTIIQQQGAIMKRLTDLSQDVTDTKTALVHLQGEFATLENNDAAAQDAQEDLRAQLRDVAARVAATDAAAQDAPGPVPTAQVSVGEAEAQREELARELALLRKETHEAHQLTGVLRSKLRSPQAGAALGGRRQPATPPAGRKDARTGNGQEQAAEDGRIDLLEEVLKRDREASLIALEAILAERGLGGL
eukprot:TRINITY_DN3118_c0_g1_i1.p1 TRINITY_DN3118_c0_g1~~TRINITY_DN3118_c0_g1_i1.p1  ORF type:complete len:1525 (+),score=538.46 TRINITY_DN3118_c0_g1_i1:247-4575(+)